MQDISIPMNICIVSNKQDIKENYSDFVDSCHKVIRINKMENLNGGKSGTKTDIAVISVIQLYLAYPPAERHLSELHDVSEIYFPYSPGSQAKQFAETEKFANWKFLPREVEEKTFLFTTAAKAICLAVYLFPTSRIFFWEILMPTLDVLQITRHFMIMKTLLFNICCQQGA